MLGLWSGWVALVLGSIGVGLSAIGYALDARWWQLSWQLVLLAGLVSLSIYVIRQARSHVSETSPDAAPGTDR